MLLRGLPRDSLTVAALQGAPYAWGDQEHLLATLIDLTAAGVWQRGGGKGPRPRPVVRPGDPLPGRHIGTARPLNELKPLLDALRRGDLDNGS